MDLFAAIPQRNNTRKGKIMHATRQICPIYVALLSLMYIFPTNVHAKPVLNDWFALGSGCRAKSNVPGNVSRRNLSANAELPDVYRVEFTFKDLSLKQDMAPKDVLQFARECAIRLNINPPKNRKIVSLRARTEVVTNKNTGVMLDAQSELIIGAVSLASERRTENDQAQILNKVDKIELESDGSSGSPMPLFGCGEAKIVGFNFSWIATRKSSDIAELSVNLGKRKNLVIEATLAACDSPVVPQ